MHCGERWRRQFFWHHSQHVECCCAFESVIIFLCCVLSINAKNNSTRGNQARGCRRIVECSCAFESVISLCNNTSWQQSEREVRYRHILIFSCQRFWRWRRVAGCYETIAKTAITDAIVENPSSRTLMGYLCVFPRKRWWRVYRSPRTNEFASSLENIITYLFDTKLEPARSEGENVGARTKCTQNLHVVLVECGAFNYYRYEDYIRRMSHAVILSSWRAWSLRLLDHWKPTRLRSERLQKKKSNCFSSSHFFHVCRLGKAMQCDPMEPTCLSKEDWSISKQIEWIMLEERVAFEFLSAVIGMEILLCRL